MGWDYTHREKGTSNLDHMRENWGEGYELLDGATVGGTFYGAVRIPGGHVIAQVTLTRWAPRDWFNFGKKDMAESWGPVEARCPERILDMLSPVEELYVGDSLTWAAEWRERCRSYHARVKSVKRGTTILHAGSKYTAMDLRRNLFRGEYGTVYRFPHWRTVQFEVLPA